MQTIRLYLLILVIALFIWGTAVAYARSQVGSKVLTCEEITGRLYIANAQLSQELQETRTQLAEIRAKCGERCAVETKP